MPGELTNVIVESNPYLKEFSSRAFPYPIKGKYILPKIVAYQVPGYVIGQVSQKIPRIDVPKNSETSKVKYRFSNEIKKAVIVQDVRSSKPNAMVRVNREWFNSLSLAEKEFMHEHELAHLYYHNEKLADLAACHYMVSQGWDWRIIYECIYKMLYNSEGKQERERVERIRKLALRFSK